MKKALVDVIIVHGIFLTFLLKFNFWLFDSMSRTFYTAFFCRFGTVRQNFVGHGDFVVAAATGYQP